MKFRGTITKVFQEKSGISKKTGNPWKMVDFIILEDSGRYPQKIMPTLSYKVDENRHLLKEGNEVEIDYFTDVQEWTGQDGVTKYMNKIQCGKITLLRQLPQMGQTQQYPSQHYPDAHNDYNTNDYTSNGYQSNNPPFGPEIKYSNSMQQPQEVKPVKDDLPF